MPEKIPPMPPPAPPPPPADTAEEAVEDPGESLLGQQRRQFRKDVRCHRPESVADALRAHDDLGKRRAETVRQLARNLLADLGGRQTCILEFLESQLHAVDEGSVDLQTLLVRLLLDGGDGRVVLLFIYHPLHFKSASAKPITLLSQVHVDLQERALVADRDFAVATVTPICWPAICFGEVGFL